MKTFKAAKGSHLKDSDAEVIGKYIEQTYPSGVTADILWRDAKREDCPIHKYFEWDIQKAAELYWADQARYLLQSIVVEVEEGKDIRAYHHVILEGGGAYVSLRDLRNAPDLWEQVVERAFREAEAWADRYETYRSCSPIVRVIRQTTKKEPRNEKRKVKGRSKGRKDHHSTHPD